MSLTADFRDLDDAAARSAAVTALCDAVEAVWDEGSYALVEVDRPWSRHNPVIKGEFARPAPIRWYLERELGKLAAAKARISITPSRPRLPFEDPALFDSLDEDAWDLRQKKLFLFRPERIDLSLDRLEHYTGTAPELFQRYLLFTNYAMHVDAFRERFPAAVGPVRDGIQMPAWHHVLPSHAGITIVNIGVGPSNAKTITDHVAVLRPDAMMMVGHCGGLRNHQEMGDLVLATGYMRADRILDSVLPTNVPITSNHVLNTTLIAALEACGARYRIGTVYTTANRNWDFNQKEALGEINRSRSIAVDMESATIAANGFRYRIPFATLLCVSDKPLHGQPKLSAEAQAFYEESKARHIAIAVDTLEAARSGYPDGLPNADLRSSDEPLMGTGAG